MPITDICQIKAILLDMDGTLIDTEALYKKSWQKSARELGFEISDETYADLVGSPLVRCLERIEERLPEDITPETFYKQLVRTQNMFKQILPVPMKPGAKELLDLLKQAGFPSALVTSSGKKGVLENFVNTPYHTLFDCVVTCDDVALYKPHPEPYLLACKQLDLLPEQTLVIEDSTQGARSAIEAGCHTVIIPDTGAVHEDIVQKALCVFDDLHQAIEKVIAPMLQANIVNKA